MVPDDCRPNKALRTTIKVFLKKKVMERETAKKKEAVEKASATPAPPATPLPDQTPAPRTSQTPAPPSTPAVTDVSNAKHGSREVSQTPQAQDDAGSKTEESVIPTEAQQDIPQASIEVMLLIHVREQLWLTICSRLVLRSPDEHLRKRLVTAV